MVKWILRISVVLILLLSGAALTFGVLLFKQREIMKGRTQRLEAAVRELAQTVEAAEASEVKVALADDQLKTFRQLPGGPAPMDVPLNTLVEASKAQLARLNRTRSVLADTSNTLVKTEGVLQTTSNELVAAKEKNTELAGILERRDSTIKEQQVLLKNLESVTNVLASEKAALEIEKTDLESEKVKLTDELAEIKKKVEILEAQQPGGAGPRIAKGQQGTVLYVNPEWNFVVIRVAEQTRKLIAPDLELLVHRADQLVGKVRVASVVDDMAVAEVLADWQRQEIQKDDAVMY